MRIIPAFVLLFLAGCSQQTGKPVNDQLFLELGKEKQYVEITGSSDKDPVILFLHGGPGWPQTPHLRYFNADITKSAILVAWEQSGCGKSYMQNPTPANMSVEQFVNDAHELTQYLKKRFQKDKIYVAGFSWGSIIGLKLVEKYPEDYAAYFAISQVVDVSRSIELSREWIKAQALSRNDTAMLTRVKRLENRDTSFCQSELDCFMKKYEMLTAYNGAIHTQEASAKIDSAQVHYGDYKEYDWFKAFMYSANRLTDELFSTNLSGVTELKVPAYFFMGRHDWSLPTRVTEEFVAKLKAPRKEIVWFENSGHEPLEEEAPAFNKAITDRLTRN